ncbi:MAG: hypothetical protein SGJ19_21600 [Planctomycetia bacterium]|nr:hypothetical protein [Planctomycetia bacterium]
MRRIVQWTFLIGAACSVAMPASASFRGSSCVGDCAVAAPQTVERTILVPEWTTETRTVTVTECRPETRTRTVTQMRCVPYTETVTRQRCVMVPQHRTRTVNYIVRKPVMETATRECVVLVPHRVERTGTRTVCRMMPVTIQRTVCEDQGHWETREVAACADCATCCEPRTARVWAPHVVTKTVPVKVMRPTMEQQTYTYYATECRPERRTKTVQLCRYVAEPRTREVTETIFVPKMVMQTCNVTRVRVEPVTRTIQCRVMAPHQVQKEVQVRVCKMVTKTVQVNVGCCR